MSLGSGSPFSRLDPPRIRRRDLRLKESAFPCDYADEEQPAREQHERRRLGRGGGSERVREREAQIVEAVGSFGIVEEILEAHERCPRLPIGLYARVGHVVRIPAGGTAVVLLVCVVNEQSFGIPYLLTSFFSSIGTSCECCHSDFITKTC